MKNTVKTGERGQNEAEKYLCAKGLILLEKNYRLRGAEIDLIMRDGEYIVFTEVKYRKSLSYGWPAESINNRKQNKIKFAARHYIACKQLSNQDFRFDAVELLETADGLFIKHTENAFY
jgi:putative endonuclease